MNGWLVWYLICEDFFGWDNCCEWICGENVDGGEFRRIARVDVFRVRLFYYCRVVWCVVVVFFYVWYKVEVYCVYDCGCVCVYNLRFWMICC